MNEAYVVNDENKEKEVPVNRAGLGKRTIAGIVDLFIMIFLLIFSTAFIVTPIAKAIQPNYSKSIEEIQNYYLASGLVKEQNSDGALIPYDDEDAKYLEVSRVYFEGYCGNKLDDKGSPKACPSLLYNENGDNKGFEAIVFENETFKQYIEQIQENEGKLTLVLTEEAKKVGDELYWGNQIYLYAQDCLTNSDVIVPLLKLVNQFTTWVTISSVVFACLITYLLIPMVTKNGKTVGKMMFHLCLTNQMGFKVKRTQIAVRFLAFVIINLFLGRMTIMMLPLVSFAVMIFTKKNMSLHDYCSATIVIDERSSFIFNNKNEFLEAVRKEEESDRIIQERRQLPDNE